MLPYEGFQPRHELNAMTGTHPIMVDETELTPLTPADVSLTAGPELAELNEPVLTVKGCHEVEGMDFSHQVAELIRSFAEQVNISMIFSMMMPVIL